MSLNLTHRINWFNIKAAELEAKAKNTSNKIKLSDSWRLEYYKYPYMISATQSAIEQRFKDIMLNIAELNNLGEIVPTSSPSQKLPFVDKFGHLIEEFNTRGGQSVESLESIQNRFSEYYKNGSPVGVELFKDYKPPHRQILVKYSKKEFLEEMLHTGTFRISPASAYSSTKHNEAIRDDEVTRTFEIPTYRFRLKGDTDVIYEGKRIPFPANGGDIPYSFIVPNYYLFSTCTKLSVRMPSDFDSDAALVITDKRKFIRKTTAAFNKQFSGWKCLHSPVKYSTHILITQAFASYNFQKTLHFLTKMNID